jgi:hypothetical protein
MVQRLALALGVECRVFVDHDLTLPPERPAARAGRPPKARTGDAVPPTPLKPFQERKMSTKTKTADLTVQKSTRHGTVARIVMKDRASGDILCERNLGENKAVGVADELLKSCGLSAQFDEAVDVLKRCGLQPQLIQQVEQQKPQ